MCGIKAVLKFVLTFVGMGVGLRIGSDTYWIESIVYIELTCVHLRYLVGLIFSGLTEILLNVVKWIAYV